ncbi:MAG: acetylxylan esterase [Pirellulales bacterium]|nr:acetylxylan esterase [Pirellulales bacterium]
MTSPRTKISATAIFSSILLVAWLDNACRAEETSLRTMQYTSRTSDAAEKWQETVRTRLIQLLKLDDLMGSRHQIDLNPRVIRSENKGSYEECEIEINTTQRRRIQAIVTRPINVPKPWPAVVCIHGHGGHMRIVHDRKTVYKGFAAELAASGYVTISTNVGQHEVYEANRILMGERLWDLLRCVDYLVGLPEVDSTRIGCAGLSLGGEMAMWLGAMDTRIVATVSSGFLTRMDQMEQNHCMCWKFDGLRELVDFADIYALTAPRALLCQNGIKEHPSQFPPDIARKVLPEIQKIYADMGKPDNVVLDVHAGGHEVDLPNLMEFLDQHLG